MLSVLIYMYGDTMTSEDQKCMPYEAIKSNDNECQGHKYAHKWRITFL